MVVEEMHIYGLHNLAYSSLSPQNYI